MGQKQQQSADSVSEPKKRRRLGVGDVDAGIEPNECIKIYLVSSNEEVEAGRGCCIDPVDLGNFFEEDGKIYGYVGLKVTFWVSTVSFHAYVDVTYESTSDAGKGITDLKTAFQNIFGENLVENKDQFLQMFTTERQYIRSVTLKGEKLPLSACNGNVPNHVNGEVHQLEVIRLVVGDMLVGHLYSRLVPLILLLVDGSSPIDVTDSSWEIYLIIKKTGDQEAETPVTLLGLAATYRFYRYPESSRLRLSQILVLPPYQRQGYGKILLEVLSKVAISEGVYDFTIEEPLDSLQHVRNCIDIPRLLACSSVQEAVDSLVPQLKEANLSKRAAQNSKSLLPPPTTMEEVRKTLKINKKQFIQCWEILLYLALSPTEKRHMDNFKTFIADRVKASVLGKDAAGPTGKQVVDVPTDYDQDVSFVMYKPQSGEGSTVEVEGDKADVEQQLEKLVEERIESIKAVAKKVSPSHG